MLHVPVPPSRDAAATRARRGFNMLAPRRPAADRPALVAVGDRDALISFRLTLSQLGTSAPMVLGVLSDDVVSTGSWPYLGQLDVLPEVLDSGRVSEVAMCLGSIAGQGLDRIADLCVARGIAVSVAIPPEHRFNGEEGHFVGRRRKRGLDVGGALIALGVLAPIFILTALAILIVDGRPILYQQDRAGLAGRSFRMWKFRTMRCNAHEERSALRESNEIRGAAFKLEDDPRVTRLGRWLRRLSVDELPQLWNVLVGEMSLVGPRPHSWDDVARYQRWHLSRLSVRPGITGLWQVELRRDTDFDRWVARDIQYLQRWSLWLDITLLARTFAVVFRGTGR